jgi:hypothetical protein
VETLLGEFSDDEHYYRRELKTLVDGVIPVLLNQVVHGDTRSSTDLFGGGNGIKDRADSMSNAVVNMGIALEKMKKVHDWVPVSDLSRLLSWLASIYPIYDNYLDAWRLGFQDLIVNLAPAAEKNYDDDSLVNAMPRNEDGDVLDDNGERVDVAYLLKRPLIRIKWIVKFLRVSGFSNPLEQE